MTVSIVVLCHDRWPETRRCLESLRRSTPPELYELLVYDNGSGPRLGAELRRRAARWPEMTVIRNDRNLHFAAAVNAGMRRARGEYFLWLNNDTVLKPGWLEGLLAVARSDRRIAAVGPTTSSMAPPQQFARPFLNRRRPEVLDAPFLGGFCFLLKRGWAERVGLLDERFVWGWEDMDYCLRLRHAGARLALARNVFVRHWGNRTMDTMQPVRRKRSDLGNRRLVLRKWAEDETLGRDLRGLFHQLLAPWERLPVEVSLVLPCRGDWPRVERCLDAIRRCGGRTGYELLAVDASRGGTATPRLKRLARGWPELKVLRARGGPPLRGVNEALRAAQGDPVVLLRPEAVVTPGWLEGLLAAARAAERLGALGPTTNGRFAGFQARTGPRPRHGRLSRRAVPVPALRDFCLLLPRAARARVGELDERFDPESGAADYCLRLAQAGLRVLLAPDVFVYRAGQDGARPPWSVVLQRRRGARLLFEKWAGHPLFRPGLA